MSASFVKWLADLSVADASTVGEKAAYLAELYNKNLPVPNAFVISTELFEQIISEFKSELEVALSKVSDLQSAYSAAKRAREVLSEISLSSRVKDILLLNYKKMNEHIDHNNMSPITKQLVTSGRDLPFVAVRASPLKNFPFQFEPILNVYGIDSLSTAIKELVLSAFSPILIYYRYKKGMSQLNLPVAIIVQKMVNAIKSGDMFTINPISNSKSEIYAQVVWGINSNMMTHPSVFIFDKHNQTIIKSKPAKQEHYYTKHGQFGELLKEPLPDHLKQTLLLSENERAALADLCNKIEQIMNFPQYVEWAVERNTIQVLQTQPITNIFTKPLLSSSRGVIINSQTSSGKAVIISAKEDLKKISHESIIISKTAGRELFPYILQSAGFICEANGLTSRAAQLCKDFLIPAIFQARGFEQVSDGWEIKFTGSSCEVIQPQIAAAQQTGAADYGTQSSDYEPTAGLSNIINLFNQLEKSLTEQVSYEARRRASGEHITENDFKRAQLISELEWQIRSLRRKLFSQLV